MVLLAHVSYVQSSGYEKQVLFTLEWGDALSQLGWRKAEPGGMGKTGPHDFTVVSNTIWVYDRVQNYIKCFSDKGELLHSIQLMCQADMEGYITSDENNNIWFHDAMGQRIWVYNDSGELQRTITYKLNYVLGEISIINGKPVAGKLINPHLIEGKTYLGKPEYEGVLFNIDETSAYNQFRGKTTHRIYKIADFSVSYDGEVIPPKLMVDDKIVEQVKFDEGIVKKYSIFFIREDDYGNFYLNLFPREHKEIPLYIFKYNIAMEKIAMVELPIPNQFYEYWNYALEIDSSGNIYYMKVRDESIQFLRWNVTP